MKKKIFSLLLAVTMVPFLFTGCSQPAEPTGNDQTPVSEAADASSDTAATPTDIEFWTFQALHVDFYKKMADLWNEANPNEPINLITTEYPFEDMHTKLLIALQSGIGAPDMVDIEIGKYANFLKGSIQLLPLNDIIEPEIDNIVQSRV
jgi:arabinosaccharide transport system substrate-binding protein